LRFERPGAKKNEISWVRNGVTPPKPSTKSRWGELIDDAVQENHRRKEKNPIASDLIDEVKYEKGVSRFPR